MSGLGFSFEVPQNNRLSLYVMRWNFIIHIGSVYAQGLNIFRAA
jgi:hypothetical protein